VVRHLDECQKELDNARRRIAYIESHEARLLSDYYDGLLSKDDYQLISKQRDDERRDLASKVDALLSGMEQYKPGFWNVQKHTDVLEWFQGQAELTRDMLDTLVERIEVDENMNVTIRTRYQDEFDAMAMFIYENGGVMA
jgi:hypothetical protein